MFGLSWDQVILILLAALFLLGPERIPTAIKWLMDSLRKARTFAAGAQSEMRSQLGPELDELRRQIAELQSLKEIKELKELRDLDPRRMVGKNLLGDEFSGGIKGFLGLTGDGIDLSAPKAAADGATPAAAAPGTELATAATSATDAGSAAATSATDAAVSPATVPPTGSTATATSAALPAESATAAPAPGADAAAAPSIAAAQWGDVT